MPRSSSLTWQVAYLAYELVTRLNLEVGVCSLLCASRSLQHHFYALLQLRDNLGVTLFHSPADFLAWC